MRGTRNIALACGAIALVLSSVAAWEAAASRGGALSSIVGVTAGEPLSAAALKHDPKFTFAVDHLDGAYFYAIAIDPLAIGDEHELIDVAAYRYGHPGYGWLAGLLSLGRPSAVPLTLLVVGLASMFVAGATASYVSSELGWSPWAGLFVALNPGLLFATMADNSEPLAMAILALSLLGWMRGRIGWAGAGFAALCLIKEQFVLVPLGILLWELVHTGAAADPERAPWRTRLAILSVGPVALGAWFVYLRSVYGEWPFQQQPLLMSPLTVPPSGYVETLNKAGDLHASVGETSQLGGAALPLLIVVAAALLIGVVRAWRLSSPIDPIFILLTILLFSLTFVQLLYPKDLMRIAAVQLSLLPAAIAGRRNAPAAPDASVMRT